MKELADNTFVTSRSYYYLLDWCDFNKETIYEIFSKNRLCDLTLLEFNFLFSFATNSDLANNCSNI